MPQETAIAAGLEAEAGRRLAPVLRPCVCVLFNWGVDCWPMPFREPRPWQDKAVMVGCQVPRPIAETMQAIATAKGVSLSRVMREALVTVYARPPRRSIRVTG